MFRWLFIGNAEQTVKACFISKRNKICKKGKRRFKLVSYLVLQAHFLSLCTKQVSKKLNYWEVLPGVLGKNRRMPTANEDYGNKEKSPQGPTQHEAFLKM